MNPTRGIKWKLTTKLEDLDFADDVSLLSHHLYQIQQKTESLHSVSKSTGLEINTETEHDTPLQYRRNEHWRCYQLGSVVNKQGGMHEDIRVRIGKARQAFVMFRNIWKNKNTGLKTKLRIFETNVKPVLLYESETRKQTKKTEQDLQVFVNKCLHQILRIRWPERYQTRNCGGELTKPPL